MKFHWQHPDLLMVEAHLYHLLIVKFPFQNKKHLCQESQILTETKQCKAKVRLRDLAGAEARGSAAEAAGVVSPRFRID